MLKLNEIYEGDCLEVMKEIDSDSIDLTVTSPPYDDLRNYNGYSFDFESVASELYRITKPGGVVVWIVADATVKGSETGTSFRQALGFMDEGFNLHDTMIWNKGGFSAVGSLKVRYGPVFEYMFVFVKGKLNTFNPIKDKPNKWAGTKNHGTVRIDGDLRKPVSNNKVIAEFGQRYNVWEIPPHRQSGDGKHPAPFPESLTQDHIISWSNPGDIVFDPFTGSGTTAKMAMLNNRNYIGAEISEEYCNIARTRISEAKGALV